MTPQDRLEIGSKSHGAIDSNLPAINTAIPNRTKANGFPAQLKIAYPLDFVERTSQTSNSPRYSRSASCDSNEEVEANARIIKEILSNGKEEALPDDEIKTEPWKSKKMPKNMRIPNIWPVKIENYDNTHSSDEDRGGSEIDDGEWEFL